MIVAKVTAAVRELVEAQVIGAATGMSRADYEAAVSAGMIPKETQAAVSSATDAQMQTNAVQKAISDNVDIQVQQTIAENMASEEVQAKLAAASEGAKSIISLKASLDSYNAFYLGLLAYTEGVAAAADGAGVLVSGASELKNGTAQLKDGAMALYGGILWLKNGTPALVDGVSQLKDGAMHLSDGLEKFNEDGIQKIVDLIDGDLDNIVVRLKVTDDVSKNYRNFSGISDDMDGQVKFIYRTDEIKKNTAAGISPCRCSLAFLGSVPNFV